MRVQLLTFPGCPNAPGTRARLERVLSRLGSAERVEEVNVEAPATSPSLRGWPSPTILVDGRDLEGLKPTAGGGCRLYAGGGTPSEALLQQGLSRAMVRRRRRDFAKGAANIGAALLSTLTCPACIGPYASLLSVLGVGAVWFSAAFMVVFPAALLLSLAAIAYSTREHKSPWPAALTVLGGVVSLAGQFVFQSDAVQRAGLPLLLGGAALNFWLVRRARAAEVPS